MSELALTASRKARLAAMAEAGDAGAKAALKLLENPTQFLSTVQVGITSIGMINAIVGEAAFSADVASWLAHWGMNERPAEIVATGFVVTVITLITIVFGELVPKRIGQLHPEAVSRCVARPMMWVAIGARPFVALLSSTTHAALRLLRIDGNASRLVTEEEIAASLEEGVGAGLIEEHEHQMVQNVFLLDDRSLPSMMLPRADIDWLDASNSVAKAIDLACSTGHSWYPVCQGGLDNVVGVVSVTKLLCVANDQERIDTHILPAVFVPETLTGMELLDHFRSHSSRLLFVVDEYGVVQGLMTPMDMLEAITGELKPKQPVDAWAIARKDGSWLIDGSMPIAEFKARLEIKELPGEDKDLFNTVAGLLQTVSGRLLATGEVVQCADWHFEVLGLDGRRIDKVLASKKLLVDSAMQVSNA